MPVPDFTPNPKWERELLKRFSNIKVTHPKLERKHSVKPEPNWQQSLIESRKGTDFDGYPFNVKPKKNPFLPDLDENDPNNMDRIFDDPPDPEPKASPEPTGDNPWREIKQEEKDKNNDSS